MIDLRGRHFLRELDFTPEEWAYLLDLSAELKAAKKSRTEKKHLEGKNIVLVFEKSSTRTRSAFEVGAYDQGANVTYLDPAGSHIGYKESAADTAKVLGRMFDGIEFRGDSQRTIEILAELSGVPVWNGLTDEWHPTQMLADQLTMREHSNKPLNEVSLAYMGDARNNVGHSILISGALSGMDIRMVAPKSLQNDPKVVEEALKIAETTGARLTITDDVAAGVDGADFLYTDVWVSMGEPDEVWAERIALLMDYQVNQALVELTNNPDVLVMHDLPAFRDRNTTVGEQIFQKFGLDGVEITNDVFEANGDVIYDQAENRMHTIKAVMVATLRD